MRKFAQNFGALTAGKVAGEVLMMLFFVMISRRYGTDGVGQYSLAIGVTSLFAIGAEFGLFGLSTKEMSRRVDDLISYFSHIYTLRVALVSISFALLVILVVVLPVPSEVKAILVLVGAYQVLSTLIDGFEAIFIAREHMHWAGLLEFSLRALIMLTGTLVVSLGGSLVTVMGALPAVALAHIGITYGIISKKYGRPILVGGWSIYRKTLHEAVPYAAFVLLSVLTLRVDIVFVGLMIGPGAAGVYNAAYKMILFTYIPIYFAAVVLLPIASRMYVHARADLARIFSKSLNIMVLVGVPASVGIWLIAPELIDTVFGEEFAESALVLRVLSILVLVACIKAVLAMFLMSCDRQGQRTRSLWTAVWISILGNIILIPTVGIVGAAAARVCSDLILVTLYALHMRWLMGWPNIGWRLFMAIAGAAAFALAFSALPSVPLGAVVVGCVVFYVGVLLLFRDIRSNELRWFLSIFKKEARVGGVASREEEVRYMVRSSTTE